MCLFALKKTFWQSPICYCLPIFWHNMCVSLTKKQSMQHTQPAHTTLPSWPPPPLLPTGNVRHAPPPTRGASTALCALLPARSARQSLPRLQQMLHACSSRHCCARSGGESNSVCANAQGSCWCARPGGKEGKGIIRECPGNVGQVFCPLNRRGK
jgi:hypothetical protein